MSGQGIKIPQFTLAEPCGHLCTVIYAPGQRGEKIKIRGQCALLPRPGLLILNRLRGSLSPGEGALYSKVKICTLCTITY